MSQQSKEEGAFVDPASKNTNPADWLAWQEM